MNSNLIEHTGMARPKKRETMPVSVRIDRDLMERLLAIGERAEYPPTLTALMEAVVREYVEKRDTPKQPPKGKR